MITFIAVSGLTYFMIGILYARSQYLRLWQKRRAANQREFPLSDRTHCWTNAEAKMCAAWRVPFWPWAIVWDIASGPFARWFTKPVTDRQAYAAQLRADADAWREKKYSGSPVEREMAAELARICTERAKEVEL